MRYYCIVYRRQVIGYLFTKNIFGCVFEGGCSGLAKII